MIEAHFLARSMPLRLGKTGARKPAAALAEIEFEAIVPGSKTIAELYGRRAFPGFKTDLELFKLYPAELDIV